MSRQRRAIPKDIEKQVLVACRRRCCLCYFLNGINAPRKGQLAHLTPDPSRTSFEDLVWLCLEHHDEFDGSTSQSKGFTPGEVRDYRDRLYAEIEAADTGGKDREGAAQIVPAGGQRSRPMIPWPARAGAPQFRMSPGVHEGKLLCQFEISNASPAPGGVEARWLGAGTNMDWKAPMPENVPRGSSFLKYQMKPTKMMPTPPADDVMLEVRFNLDDGPHGGRWKWPVHQHESKGHWILDSHLGSGVHQPLAEDAW